MSKTHKVFISYHHDNDESRKKPLEFLVPPLSELTKFTQAYGDDRAPVPILAKTISTHATFSSK